MLKACIIGLLLVAATANAESVDTRVAVLEQEFKMICDTLLELKANMATKEQVRSMEGKLADIKELVNPRLAKMDAVIAWKDAHVREYEREQERRDNTLLYIILSVFGVSGLSTGGNILWQRRIANHDEKGG